MHSYVFLSEQGRHSVTYQHLCRLIPGDWHWIKHEEQFTASVLQELSPQFVFVPHWSYKIAKEITERFQCVMFHMTDLPYGRGGSPLQNLIVRGKTSTQLTAFKCTDSMDAGPIYAKLPLSLQGSATEIFARADELVISLIELIIKHNITPEAQSGESEIFVRRNQAQSDIAPLFIDGSNLHPESTKEKAPLIQIYDHIRMLDAQGYPRAYMQGKKIRAEFSDAKQTAEGIKATVLFREISDE